MFDKENHMAAAQLLRGITTLKNFFYIEQDINLKLCIYTDFDMLSTNLTRYFGCGFSFPWKQYNNGILVHV